MDDIRTTRVDDDSMPSMLRWHARHRPDATAIVFGDRHMSYAELDRRSDATARALLRRGLHPGDRVASLLPNRPEYLELYQAVAKAGLALVPINTALTAPEIDHILEDSQASLLLRDPALPVETGLPTVVLPDGGTSMLDDGSQAVDEDVPLPPPDPDAVFFQGYTSGTTGRPKGCVQRAGAFVAHHRRSMALYRHDADDVMLMPGPLFHEAPVLFSLAQLFFGGTVVLLPRFDADEALRAIQRERVTLVGFAVPVMLDRISEVPDPPATGTVRGIITAGAPLHPETTMRTLERFPHAELHEFYGGTEIGIVTAIGHRADRAHGSSVGRPIPGTSVLLLDEHDEPVPTGEIGQVYATPVMMDGYHRRPDATAAATRTFDGVEWFTLGDLARADDDGHLYLVDRKSHMIITGGENVYPAEVEAALLEHPEIDDVAVLGLPHPRWGEAVTAVVVTTSADLDLDLEGVRAFCRTRLAGYKTPRRLALVAEIPRTASGKILKHRLRSQLAVEVDA